MQQRLAWVATAVLCLVASTFAAIWVSRPPAPRGATLEDLAHDERWEFAWPSKSAFVDLPARFNLPVRVTLSDEEGSAVRMLVNASEPGSDGAIERAAFVDVTPSAVVVGRVEGGFALALGRAEVDLVAGEAHDVSVRRRGAELVVAVDGRFVIAALEPHLNGGRVGVGRAKGARGEVWPVRGLAELPEFSDGFMRTPEEPGPWEVHSGQWHIDTLLTPSMSANGFSYRGRSKEGAALASTGSPAWDRYEARVSMHGEAGEAMGIAFAFGGPDSHCIFRWRANDTEVAGPERELVLVRPGEGGEPVEEVLATSRGGYRPGQWYRVAAVLGFGQTRVVVDEHEILRAERPEFLSGGIALWSSGEKGAVFDDVLVTPDGSVEDRLAAAPRAPPAAAGEGPGVEPWRARWESIGGEWRTTPEGIVARTRDGAKLLTGSTEWRRASVEVEAEANSGECGLVLNYLDESDYVAFRISGDRARLQRVHGGRPIVMHEARAPAPAPSRPADAPGGVARRLRLVSDAGYLAGYVDGSLVVEGYDESSSHGRAGLWSSDGEAVFRGFRTRFLPHIRPVPLVNPVFEVDNIMGRWAGESADWYRGVETGGDRKVYWHRAPFHGDVELAMDVPDADSAKPGATIALGIAKSGDKPGNGYGWSVGVPKAEDGRAGTGWHCRFVREGVEEADIPLDSGHRPESVFLRRRGRHVIAGVNGETLKEFRDPAPLDGSRVAFLVRHLNVDPANVRLYGGLVRDYRFSSAPVDWRVADGDWKIAKRWECDPRWSFLVGFPFDWPKPEAKSKLVGIWNKRSFPGDVVVDFFIGPKMANPALGREYQRYGYVRDFNVTISADGKDFSSGYTFMFGGFDNQKAAILRGGRILAEDKSDRSRYPRNTMTAHQQWFRIRAERSGGKLTYRAYFMGREWVALEAEDPEPLTGDRIAIWSYDCPIVIARLRIAGAGGGSLESPDFSPQGRVRTPYDGPTDDDAGSEATGEGDLL